MFEKTLLLFCLLAPYLAEAAELNKPSVLFLFTDDQRADTIAALGNQNIKTPNLDRLVSRGLAFDHAYMQGGLHGATCVPSRAMLLSGRSLFQVDEKLLRDETWPAAFGRNGYNTFLTGKWHNDPSSIAKSFLKARSVFTGGMTNPLSAPLSDLESGKIGKPRKAHKHACAIFADEAITFIKTQPVEKPFFCYVAFDGPHDPHIVPDDYALQYDPASIPLPANFLPQHPWDNGEMSIRDEQLLLWPRTKENVQKLLAEYYRYISYLDEQIGRIVDVLDASPQAKNTIVVFSSDSGVARGSHGLIGKQNCYEHSMRVPLIIAGPGIPENKRTNAMCYLFDVMPTLGVLCGVAGAKSVRASDFSSVIKNPQAAHRDNILLAYRDAQRAILHDHWKLIRYPKVDQTQLFDLTADPNEIHNLAASPEHQQPLAEMRRLLEIEMQAFDDKAALSVENIQQAEWHAPIGKSKNK
jgi:arylsulfatase A-like enzyme